jgi:hypothetical protein
MLVYKNQTFWQYPYTSQGAFMNLTLWPCPYTWHVGLHEPDPFGNIHTQAKVLFMNLTLWPWFT